MVTAELIRAFIFATQIVQSLYFLNTKFQASSHLVWLESLVCVGLGRKPRRPVFSQRGSYGKNTLKIFFPETTAPNLMKLCMKHQKSNLFIICASHDPGLTLTYFTARSNYATYIWYIVHSAVYILLLVL